MYNRFQNTLKCGFSYRYGFNGMEKDDDVKGGGNSYTTQFRQYDPRLGRWLSLDPLRSKFPHQSPYAAFDNNPVFFTDILGMSADSSVVTNTVSSTFDSESGDVTVVGKKVTVTDIYSTNKDGEDRWIGTVTQTINTTVVIDENGDIKSSETETNYMGHGAYGSWDLSAANNTSTDVSSLTKETRSVVTQESNFRWIVEMSSHEYIADFAKRRNIQNKREFNYTILPRTVELATAGGILQVLAVIVGVTGDLTFSPTSVMGLDNEDPNTIVNEFEF